MQTDVARVRIAEDAPHVPHAGPPNPRKPPNPIPRQESLRCPIALGDLQHPPLSDEPPEGFAAADASARDAAGEDQGRRFSIGSSNRSEFRSFPSLAPRVEARLSNGESVLVYVEFRTRHAPLLEIFSVSVCGIAPPKFLALAFAAIADLPLRRARRCRNEITQPLHDLTNRRRTKPGRQSRR